MLPKNSFFKNIPKVIELEQRLVFEAAGWAIDTIFLSYEAMRATAATIKPSSEHLELASHEIFTRAWAMIDQTHMLRSLLRRLSPPEESQTAMFIMNYEAVTSLRNAMDHLHGNIKNLANKAKPLPPVFGALSFCAVGPDQVAKAQDGTNVIRGCRVFTLTAGAFTHPTHRFVMTNPAGRRIELPVDLFEFEAFEHRICLSDLVRDLSKLVELYDTVGRQSRDDDLRKFARENSLDEEKILNECLAGTVLLGADISFDKPRETDTEAS
jgi:hypothetical protein